MNLLGLALVFTLGVFEDPNKEFFEDFRDKKIENLKVTPSYPDAINFMKSEAEGLRLTLPTGSKKHEVTAVIPPFNFKGDFEFTAGYEIIKVDPHNGGSGIAFEIYLLNSGPPNEALVFYRNINPDNSGQYFYSRRINDAQGKRQDIRSSDKPVTFGPVKSGQIRIRRIGSIAVLSAAEPYGNEFRELFQVPFANEDTKRFRVGLNPRSASSFADLRLLDLRMNGDLLSTDPTPLRDRNPSGVNEKAKPGGKTWLWLSIGLFLSLLIGALLVWWRKARINKGEVQLESTANRAETTPVAEPVRASAPISILCSACAKELKAKAELRGKKIKCPQCGQVVLVPETV